MKTIQLSRLQSISRKVIFLALTLWFCFSSLLTWATAQEMKYNMFESLPAFLWTDYINDSKVMPGQFENTCIKSFTRPYSEISLNSFLTRFLPHDKSYSSNDWIYGKWHTIYGFEAALGYYDQDFNPLLIQGNYLTFEYITGENWQDQTIESTGYGYINLDQIPEFKAYFESTPWGNFGLDSLFKVMKMTGTFAQNEFIPDSIQYQSFIDSYHPVENPALHRIRELEDKQLIVWEPIIEEEKSASSVTIYACNLYAYRYDYEPFYVQDQSMTLPELLRYSLEKNPSAQKHSLIESYITVSVQKSDDLIIAASVRFWPLKYAVLRLIPYCLISLALVLLLLKLILMSIQKELITHENPSA